MLACFLAFGEAGDPVGDFVVEVLLGGVVGVGVAVVGGALIAVNGGFSASLFILCVLIILITLRCLWFVLKFASSSSSCK